MFQRINKTSCTIFIGLVFVCSSVSSQENVTSHIRNGDYELKSRNYTQAIQFYRKALNINPDSKVALKKYANASLQLGNQNDAFTAYTRVLQLDALDKEASIGISAILMDRKQPDLAFAALQDLITEDPNDPELMAAKAYILMNTGKNETALRILRDAYAKNPKDRKTAILLSRANSKAGNLLKAKEILAEMANEYPEDPEIFNEMAKEIFHSIRYEDHEKQMNKVSEAEALLDTALKLDPKYIPAIVLKIKTLVFKGKFKEASMLLPGVLSGNPNIDIFYISSYIYTKLNLQKELETVLKSANNLDESEFFMRFLTEEYAVKNLAQFSPLRKKLGLYRIHQYKLHKNNFLEKEAIFHLERAKKLIPENPTVVQLYGEYLRRTGQSYKYLQYIQWQYALDKTNSLLQNNLENYLNKIKNSLTYKEGFFIFKPDGITHQIKRPNNKLVLMDLLPEKPVTLRAGSSRIYTDSILFFLNVKSKIDAIPIHKNNKSELVYNSFFDGFSGKDQQVIAFGGSESNKSTRFSCYGTFEESTDGLLYKIILYDQKKGQEIGRKKFRAQGRNSLEETSVRISDWLENMIPISGNIVKINDEKVIINLGFADKMKIGMEIVFMKSNKEYAKGKITSLDEFISEVKPETKGWSQYSAIGDEVQLSSLKKNKQ